MLRWVQIQPDDICGLPLEVWIIGSHVALEPMRSKPVLAPHTRHHHMGEAQMRTEFARAPVRGTVCWGAAGCLQNAVPQLSESARWEAVRGDG
jgi:hypothetical protein